MRLLQINHLAALEDGTDDDRDMINILQTYLGGNSKGTRRNTLMNVMASRSFTPEGYSRTQHIKRVLSH